MFSVVLSNSVLLDRDYRRCRNPPATSNWWRRGSDDDNGIKTFEWRFRELCFSCSLPTSTLAQINIFVFKHDQPSICFDTSSTMLAITIAHSAPSTRAFFPLVISRVLIWLV